jgi:hypothetical protein
MESICAGSRKREYRFCLATATSESFVPSVFSSLKIRRPFFLGSVSSTRALLVFSLSLSVQNSVMGFVGKEVWWEVLEGEREFES